MRNTNLTPDGEKYYGRGLYKVYFALGVLAINPIASAVFSNIYSSPLSQNPMFFMFRCSNGLFQALHTTSIIFVFGITYAIANDLLATGICIDYFADGFPWSRGGNLQLLRSFDRWSNSFVSGIGASHHLITIAALTTGVTASMFNLFKLPQHNLFYPYTLPLVASIAVATAAAKCYKAVNYIGKNQLVTKFNNSNLMINFKDKYNTPEKKADWIICHNVTTGAYIMGAILGFGTYIGYCGARIFKISFDPKVHPLVEIAIPMSLFVGLLCSDYYIKHHTPPSISI